MKSSERVNGKERIPDQADETIKNCISLETPRSFFLFAGAGSGKTGSLVAALNFARENLGERFVREKRKIGVITYTNAAADEINRRSDQCPFFAISTIHCFAWELIKPFQRDIKTWLVQKLEEEIRELEAKSSRTKGVELPQKRARLLASQQVSQFCYSPIGANTGRGSLNHGEVLSLCTTFLARPLMQEIFISQYPILFIDESQDTNKVLMDTFLDIQNHHAAHFMLGLFGDMMQRIYLDGKEHLDEAIGADWATPCKSINYRSPQRIIRLINSIRADTDRQQQNARSEAVDGLVRVFITQSTEVDKAAFEDRACQIMATTTGDPHWIAPGKEVKTLTLEHKMAAVRLGFELLYNALDHSKKLRARAFEKLTTLDPRPQLREIAFLTEILLPLVQAHRKNDTFSVASILKKYSPLLQPIEPTEQTTIKAEHGQIEQTKLAAEALFYLWADDADPDIKSILTCLSGTGLLTIPDKLKQGMALDVGATTSPDVGIATSNNEGEETGDSDPEERLKQQTAWAAFVDVPFSQVLLFHQYIKGESSFDTHQGVKGLEFSRVMVILDDEAAGGNNYKYDKLFGATALSEADIKNINANKDSTLSRTNRLFYVICSRAQQSLAIVIYSANPTKVRETLITKNIFAVDEIVMGDC